MRAILSLRSRFLLSLIDIFLVFVFILVITDFKQAVLFLIISLVFLLPGFTWGNMLGLSRYGFYQPHFEILGFAISTFICLVLYTFKLFSSPLIITALLLLVSFVPLLIKMTSGYKKNASNPKEKKPIETNSSSEIKIKACSVIITCILLITVFLPISHIGKPTLSGYAYRAYFNSDFLKNVTLTAEIAKNRFPPQNPYLHGKTLHYYWLIYFFPALLTKSKFFAVEISSQNAFIMTTILIARIFLLCLFLFLTSKLKNLLAAFWATVLAFTCYSYEIFYVWWDIKQKGFKLFSHFLAYNVDGATRWFIGHPQLDGYYRSLIFTPQHLIAVTLLILLMLFILSKKMPQLKKTVLIGFILGLSLGYSVIIALVISVWYFLYAGLGLLDFKNLRSKLMSIFIPLSIEAVFYRYFRYFKAFTPNTETPVYHPFHHVLARPFFFLLMNLGPLLVFMVPGIVILFFSSKRMFLLTSLAGGISLIFIFFISLPNHPSDIGLKSGLVLNLCACIGTAAFLTLFNKIKVKLFKYAFLSLILIISIPAFGTTLLDMFNSSNVGYRQFTTNIKYSDMKACFWIKHHLPGDCVIQLYPDNEISDCCSLIPTFAERSTCMGDEIHSMIFQIPKTAYEKRRMEIKSIFEKKDISASMSIIDEYGIDYLFIGDNERNLFPEKVKQFSKFPIVYSSDGILIIKVSSSK